MRCCSGTVCWSSSGPAASTEDSFACSTVKPLRRANKQLTFYDIKLIKNRHCGAREIQLLNTASRDEPGDPGINTMDLLQVPIESCGGGE
ncbi:unnamed protein product [Caretta caretta]